MNAIPLPGLRATEPIGFLAAVGLLRVCTARGTLGRVTLGWSEDAGWPALLHTERTCDQARLVEELIAHMRGRAALPAFAGNTPDGVLVGGAVWKDIKVAPSLFREWVVATRQAATTGRREDADFLSAFGSELITARSSGDLKPSALHMTSARQQFLEASRKLSSSLDPSIPQPRRVRPPDAAFREALFGPWQYGDEFSALGLDPNTEAIYALVATAPGDEKPVSTRAAVWLAVEALPLFPSLPIGTRLQTRCFDRRSTAFRWPVWDGGLSVHAVRTVLGSREVGGPERTSQAIRRQVEDGASSEPARRPRPNAVALRRLGIRAVMESNRVTIGQGYGQLRPAIRVGEITG